jgi:hypothetical protein
MNSIFLLRLSIVLVVVYTLSDFALGYAIESKTNALTLFQTLKGLAEFKGLM